MNTKEVLRIAIQKNGRLHEQSMRLLNDCGVKVSNGSGTLKTRAANFPVEILFLRDDDIPQYVEDGVVDAGIAGENLIREKNKHVKVLEKLGFAKCRLALAIRKDEKYSGLSFFNGKKIATSYPNILKAFLKKHKIRCDIEEISGSVEIAPGIGLADGIMDIVSTGSTLFINGLREVETVMESQAVLVVHKGLHAARLQIAEKLLFRIRAVNNARNNKYILLNAPDEALEKICKILPGIKSPTILPLARKGWSSLHSVVKEDTFWEVIDELKKAGAEGILVVPIEKMVT
ncbi:MAG: ATP phosphoribosyltransferase [Chitinophagales bacterium]|nr:MAG: ATP phosphoribosyltransferase [Chitinophagales bacterium]